MPQCSGKGSETIMYSNFHALDRETNSIDVITSRRFQKISVRSAFLYPTRAMKSRSSGPREVELSLLAHPNTRLWKKFNQRATSSKFVLILSDFLDELPQGLKDSLSGKEVLIGPNIDFTSERNIQQLKYFPGAGFLAPTSWPLKIIAAHADIDEKNMYSWFAGVDSDRWKPSKTVIKDVYVLLYVKDFSAQSEIQECKQYFENQQINYFQLEYGKYTNDLFRSTLAKTSHMVVIGGTESQGIAHFQAWSMNVPTLVSRRETHEFAGKLYPASSSPYLNDQTGQFSTHSSIEIQDLDSFLSEARSFSPREWILANATIEIAFQNLCAIFNLQSSPREKESG